MDLIVITDLDVESAANLKSDLVPIVIYLHIYRDR